MTEMTEVPMFTSRFKAVYDLAKETDQRAFLPVRTSVGKPRFMPEAGEWAFLSCLAPYGLLKVDDRDQFAEQYRLRLAKHGLEAIDYALRSLHECQTPGSWQATPPEDRKPLALLCYEDLDAGEWCHRRLFAEWWQEQTGQAIEDLNTAEALRQLAHNAHPEPSGQLP